MDSLASDTTLTGLVCPLFSQVAQETKPFSMPAPAAIGFRAVRLSCNDLRSPSSDSYCGQEWNVLPGNEPWKGHRTGVSVFGREAHVAKRVQIPTLRHAQPGSTNDSVGDSVL